VVLDAQNIMDKVVIWHMKTAKAKIWILRKHPGLAMLSPEEVREVEDDVNESEDDMEE